MLLSDQLGGIQEDCYWEDRKKELQRGNLYYGEAKVPLEMHWETEHLPCIKEEKIILWRLLAAFDKMYRT